MDNTAIVDEVFQGLLNLFYVSFLFFYLFIFYFFPPTSIYLENAGSAAVIEALEWYKDAE